MSETRITRRSMSDRRTGRTDWSRLDRLTDDEIKGEVESDKDAAPLVTAEWLAKAEVIAPQKKAISIRLDADILDYFQKGGVRYQTRINQVLRAYIDARTTK